MKVSAPCPAEQGGLHLRIELPALNFDISGVDPAASIEQLRSYIIQVANYRRLDVNIAPSCKLTFKGSLLKDNKTVSKSGLKGGSKVVVRD